MNGYSYSVFDIDLSVARTDSAHTVGQMSTMAVRNISDINCNLKIKFDSTAAIGIVVKPGEIYNFKDVSAKNSIYFSTVYITNDAVSSGTAQLVFTTNIEVLTPLRLTSDIITEGLHHQRIAITDAATPIPTTPLTDRINLLLVNRSGVTIYLGDSGVDSAAGVTQGIPLEDGGQMAITISSGAILYGIVDVGDSPANLHILEGS